MRTQTDLFICIYIFIYIYIYCIITACDVCIDCTKLFGRMINL